MSTTTPAIIEIRDPAGDLLWSYSDGSPATGLTSMTYLKDGTQECIIEALIAALAEARGQLRAVPQVLNVVPYGRSPTA